MPIYPTKILVTDFEAKWKRSIWYIKRSAKYQKNHSTGYWDKVLQNATKIHLTGYWDNFLQNIRKTLWLDTETTFYKMSEKPFTWILRQRSAECQKNPSIGYWDNVLQNVRKTLGLDTGSPRFNVCTNLDQKAPIMSNVRLPNHDMIWYMIWYMIHVSLMHQLNTNISKKSLDPITMTTTLLWQPLLSTTWQGLFIMTTTFEYNLAGFI